MTAWVMEFKVLVKSRGSSQEDLDEAREMARQIEGVLHGFQPNPQLVLKEVRFSE